MLILSLDSTASPASVCLYEDEKVLADFYINTGLTHSQTLMRMTESVLEITGKSVDDIDLFAITNGPGSFTGVRIGVSAIKGMAYAQNKPCIAVSTLESMAYNDLALNGVVCACMDARRNQVYNALFCVKDGCVERLCDDRAISVDELLSELQTIEENVTLFGDGASLVYASVSDSHIRLAPLNIRFQNASSAAIAAERKYQNKDELLSASELNPYYLRLSQAEREFNNKKKEG
ncbi:MAG: tRNA (adenosine(37)-N6)-threonylcarbamoyltransferase complex dimerization subunit type 1 TsaB [Ruminococcus sp.]|nr:tRNA (adenosine(37)-N6)-threonylcarbamoyltransferase complex dimerization subunit type 1 TsaB [Ruminococcus sp.]